MSDENLSREHHILVTLRQALASIVRDTTPPRGMKHPLADNTLEDIRQCFALISARERELNDALGNPQRQPRYIDEPKTSQVVQFVKPKKK